MWPQADVKLSSGPHGIPPKIVKGIQRDRLLKATAEVVAREGYAATTVRKLLAHSRTSRRTYYALFTDMEDCYLAMFGELAQQMRARFSAGFERGAEPGERVRLALESLTDLCASEPDAACACLVESLAAGAAGHAARSELIAALANTLTPALAELRPADPNPALTAQAVVGGVFELLYGPLARHDRDGLEALAADIGELPLIQPVGA
jgi:AcrR family transcriptional regulator